MVTTEDMAKLWDSGVGADIAFLEGMLLEVKNGYDFGVRLMEPRLYWEYVAILKKFRGSRIGELDSVEIPIKTLYSSPQEFLEGYGRNVEVLARMKPIGAEIKCIYRFGELETVSIGVREATSTLRSILPKEIVELSDEEYTEITGVVGNYTASGDIVRATIQDLLDGKTDSLSVYATDISGVEFEDKQSGLKFLYGCGFNVPHTAVINGFSLGVIDKFQVFFEGMADKGLGYRADGYEITANKLNEGYKLNIRKGKYWEDSLRSSVIEKVNFKERGLFKVLEAKIKPVEIYEGKCVERLELGSVRVMEKYGYTVGNTVYFRYDMKNGVRVADSSGNIIVG